MSMKLSIWNDKGLTGLNLVLKVKKLTLSVVLWNKHMSVIAHSDNTRAHLIFLILSLKTIDLKENLIWNLKQILLIRSV